MKLLLVRGVPGSGKTTLAKIMHDFYHVEADMYFVNEAGYYLYDHTKIGLAHDWCQRKAAQWLEKGWNVVVSNTFTRLWEMEPYIKMAATLGAELEVVVCTGNFVNVHGCPEASVKKMRDRFEPYPQEKEAGNSLKGYDNV